jgi:opine dehydrogenase
MTTVVLGSGGGALTIASELGLAGRVATLADLPTFAANLEPIGRAGGVWIRFAGEEERLAPVARISNDPAGAASTADLVIVCVPSFGHRPFAEVLAPILRDGQSVLWIGEGGGSFANVAALREVGRRPAVRIGESNSLPYGGAKVTSPGRASAMRKSGGTYVAGLPGRSTAEVAGVAAEIWPWVKPAANAWDTLLLNFNAIDHVATMITNLGSIEGRSDVMRLWGEGATPGVARVIGAVDEEYALLRSALELPVDLRYEDFLVAQGLVDSKRETIQQTILASTLAETGLQCGPHALEHRFVAEDVPYSLVLASSLAAELGVDVPVIDGLIAIASAAAGRDFRREGRTLADWGLQGKGRAGLLQAVEEGWW